MSALVLCGGVDAHDEREAFAADHGAKGQHGATGAGRFSRNSGHHSRVARERPRRGRGSASLSSPFEESARSWVLHKPKEASPGTPRGGVKNDSN